MVCSQAWTPYVVIWRKIHTGIDKETLKARH